MYHRGVISGQDLQMLMRAQDVMPWWRDKLIRISHAPYTRVDARRMHALGILNRQELKRAYLDLGYDEEKAENMVRFTVAYNTEKEKDLSKTDILGGYSRGILTRQETIHWLEELGYSREEAEFYIAREDYEQAQEIKQLKLDVIKGQYLAGEISRQETEVRMAEMDLKATEIQALANKWGLQKNGRRYQPPISVYVRWLRGGIITAEEFEKELSARGIGLKYIKRFIQEVE